MAWLGSRDFIPRSNSMMRRGSCAMHSSDFLPDSVAKALGISEKAKISSAPQGMTSELAFIDDQGRQSVLKHCQNPIYVEWLRREHQVLVALAECPLRIPRVLGYQEIRHQGWVCGRLAPHVTPARRVFTGRSAFYGDRTKSPIAPTGPLASRTSFNRGSQRFLQPGTVD
jgi:hypothetical protein